MATTITKVEHYMGLERTEPWEYLNAGGPGLLEAVKLEAKAGWSVRQLEIRQADEHTLESYLVVYEKEKV